jgi:hypothetical protein
MCEGIRNHVTVGRMTFALDPASQAETGRFKASFRPAGNPWRSATFLPFSAFSKVPKKSEKLDHRPGN